MPERAEYVRVQLMDFPHSIRGFTVMVDPETFIIFINSRLSYDIQCEAYDHEIGHIDRKDFDKMYSVDEIENIGHALAG